MSVYTTLNITRQKAITLLVQHLLGDIADDELEQWLDIYLEPRLYNTWIVPDGTEINDDDVV